MFGRAVERWQKPPLATHLDNEEQVIVAINAFSGLLGHPLIAAAPIWGSTRWDLALTNRRLLAIETPFLPWLSAGCKRVSIPLGEIDSVDVFWDWGLQANIRIQSRTRRSEFKLWGSPRELHAFKQEVRKFARSGSR